MFLDVMDNTRSDDPHSSKNVIINGQTLLHRASQHSTLECVKNLLNLDVEVGARDELGNTALHLCAKHNWDEEGPKIARFLIERGADVNAKNNEGKTPLDEAKNCQIAIQLLRSGGQAEKFHFTCDCFGDLNFDSERDTCPVNRHLEKWRLLGFGVNRPSKGDIYEEIIRDAIEAWEEELKTLKDVAIAWYPKKLSLYEIIFMNKRSLEKYAKNDILIRVYRNSGENFEELFPHFGFLINLHYRKAFRRKKLLNVAEHFLERVFGDAIPCSRKIMNFLSDDELKIIFTHVCS